MYKRQVHNVKKNITDLTGVIVSDCAVQSQIPNNVVNTYKRIYHVIIPSPKHLFTNRRAPAVAEERLCRRLLLGQRVDRSRKTTSTWPVGEKKRKHKHSFRHTRKQCEAGTRGEKKRKHKHEELGDRGGGYAG